jgi:hypothetical protein
MKITTKTTTTETKEIEVNFPCFTKVEKFSTAFYYIESENVARRIEIYLGAKIATISHCSSVNEAFESGFEFIDKTTFFNNYDAILGQMCNDMEELQARLVEDDRTEFEIEQDRKEAEEQRRVDDYCDKSNEY